MISIIATNEVIQKIEDAVARAHSHKSRYDVDFHGLLELVRETYGRKCMLFVSKIMCFPIWGHFHWYGLT